MEIRQAQKKDLKQINDIINWHSQNGFSTFQEEMTLENRVVWFKKFENSVCHLIFVMKEQEKVLGVAYSFSYRDGGVFKDTLETSIYLHPNVTGKGLGSLLYDHLFKKLSRKEIHRVVVGIALPNEASIKLHKKFGFEEIGIFDEYAFYKESYRSSMWLQKKMNR